jgi:hypothetical protein
MQPEQVLYFSDNCFGTADAISFSNGMLRIHDLKTGIVPAKMDQLLVYAALFCLEYGVDPIDIQAELRIYQNDNVLVEKPVPEDIDAVMGKIIDFDLILDRLRNEGEMIR